MNEQKAHTLTLSEELDYLIWLKNKTNKDIKTLSEQIKKDRQSKKVLQACWACGEMGYAERFSTFRDGTICCNCAESINQDCKKEGKVND